MSRYKRKPNLINSSVSCMLMSAGFGIIVILLCLLCFAMLLSKLNAPPALVSAMASVSLCVGGYCGGYLCARKKRRNGLAMGVACGVIIFMIVMIFGIVFAKAAIGVSSGGKLFFTMLCGAIGGVVGVNTKKRRY